MSFRFLALLFFTSISGPLFGASTASLSFMLGDRSQAVTFSELENDLPVETIEIFDQMHGKTKTYRAFELARVLQLGFGDALSDSTYSEIVFIALDGYEAISSKTRALEPGGYLTFKDLDVPGENWEPVGAHAANPGPFYIVWSKPSQSTANEYPWPWQVASMRLVRFADRYPAVYPTGIDEDSSVYRGFEIFKGRCFRCHAISQQGGKIGPDLNHPKNILAYTSVYMVREFIRNPSKYRVGRMPDQSDLSDQQLDDIVDYLWYLYRRH